MSVDVNTGDEAAGTAGRASDVAALEPGHTIYEYRIDKVLGGGGFGITYLAQDVNLQLPVAIKEYFPANVAVRAEGRTVRVRSEEGSERFNWGLDRFVDEARALASFRHPNIVRVLRYFKENGTAYIVMDYESGDPLKHWAARQRSLDQAALLQLVYPCSTAWRRCTSSTSCTATSNPTTSTSAPTAARCCWTSAPRAGSAATTT